MNTNPIHVAVNDAISSGTALTARDIGSLRKKSAQSIKAYKMLFWAAIVIFNLLIWVPLPISTSLLIALAVLSLATALVGPILGIRKHLRILDLLEESSSGPRKNRVDVSGKAYIEQVRKEGRNFIKAEMEALEGGRDSAVA